MMANVENEKKTTLLPPQPPPSSEKEVPGFDEVVAGLKEQQEEEDKVVVSPPASASASNSIPTNSDNESSRATNSDNEASSGRFLNAISLEDWGKRANGSEKSATATSSGGKEDDDAAATAKEAKAISPPQDAGSHPAKDDGEGEGEGEGEEEKDDDSFDSFESGVESQSPTIMSHFIGDLDATAMPAPAQRVAGPPGKGGEERFYSAKMSSSSLRSSGPVAAAVSKVMEEGGGSSPSSSGDESGNRNKMMRSSRSTGSLVSVDVPLDEATMMAVMANTNAHANTHTIADPLEKWTAARTPANTPADNDGAKPPAAAKKWRSSSSSGASEDLAAALERVASKNFDGSGDDAASASPSLATVGLSSITSLFKNKGGEGSVAGNNGVVVRGGGGAWGEGDDDVDDGDESSSLTGTVRSQSTATVAALLPSYNFRPAVAQKSEEIMMQTPPSSNSSYRGPRYSAKKRGLFRGSDGGSGGLLAWRGGKGKHHRRPSDAARDAIRESSEAAVTTTTYVASDDDAASREKGGYDSLEDKKSRVANTEVTDDDNYYDKEEKGGTAAALSNGIDNRPDDGIDGGPPSSSTNGPLLRDTYSLMYVHPICSTPFLYAILLFLFRSLVYCLLLSSLVDFDADGAGNPLGVPVANTLGIQMRVAQGCAMLIAVFFNGVEIMVALDNLLRTPDAIVSMDRDTVVRESRILPSRSVVEVGRRATTTSTTRRSFPVGARFALANLLRLVEGCLAVTSSFVLIVGSVDIIEMFVNFAALEFIVNLDNLAFALAEHGLISDRLRDAARVVGGLGFSYHRDSDGGGGESRHAREKKRNGGATTCDPSGLARLKGSYVARLLRFLSPVRVMRNHPDGTRRTTLFLMTATLFVCWGWILSGLPQDYDDIPRSIDVDFPHAHVVGSTETIAEAEEGANGLGPFLSTKSGSYVAAFVEEHDDDAASIRDRAANVFAGRSSNGPSFLAYRKLDPKVEIPATQDLTTPARLPSGYVDVVFFDESTRRWAFASCEPDADLASDDRACAGPVVESVETEVRDLTALSSGFRVVDGPVISDILPAAIAGNECGRREWGAPGLRSADSSSRSSSDVVANAASCGLGECSEPLEDLGGSRQCICPSGQYGPSCADHYGLSCATLEILPLEGVVDEPPAADHFNQWEIDRPFYLQDEERGVGNTPIWQRSYGTKGLVDRVEFHEGAHWTIVRRVDTLHTRHTRAISEAVSSSSAMDYSGGASAQPPPAGLTFYAPRSGAWGTVPDAFRPFASYRFRCKAAPMASLGARSLTDEPWMPETQQ